MNSLKLDTIQIESHCIEAPNPCLNYSGSKRHLGRSHFRKNSMRRYQ
jgi:hypothetical protein